MGGGVPGRPRLRAVPPAWRRHVGAAARLLHRRPCGRRWTHAADARRAAIPATTFRSCGRSRRGEPWSRRAEPRRDRVDAPHHAARSLLVALAVVVVAPSRSGRAPTSPAAPRPPNLVVIFADDLGYGDLGAFGAPDVRTPRLDRDGRRGPEVDQRSTSSRCAHPAGRRCSPAGCRCATACSARQPRRARAFFAPMRLRGCRSRRSRIAEVLKARGYATGMVGKWHLGHLPAVPADAAGIRFVVRAAVLARHADDRARAIAGWDTAGLLRAEAGVLGRRADARRRGDRTAGRSSHADPALHRGGRALHRGAQRAGPFFLYLAHKLPHIPLARSAEFVGGQRRRPLRRRDRGARLEHRPDPRHAARRWASIATRWCVFTSDNGPWLPFRTHGGSAGPLRDGKGTTWEGGVRTPAIFWWPGTIRPGDGDRASARRWTCCRRRRRWQAPRLARRSRRSTASISGRGRSRPAAAQPRADQLFYYWDSELRAVRKGRYKAHFVTSGAYGDGEPRTEHRPPLLYDLQADPGERVRRRRRPTRTWSPTLTREAEAHRRTVSAGRAAVPAKTAAVAVTPARPATPTAAPPAG